MEKDKIITYSVQKCENCGYVRVSDNLESDEQEFCIFCGKKLTRNIKTEVKNEY